MRQKRAKELQMVAKCTLALECWDIERLSFAICDKCSGVRHFRWRLAKALDVRAKIALKHRLELPGHSQKAWILGVEFVCPFALG